MPDSLARVLADYIKVAPPNDHGYLFVTRNKRPPSSNKVVESRLWPILDALEIRR